MRVRNWATAVLLTLMLVPIGHAQEGIILSGMILEGSATEATWTLPHGSAHPITGHLNNFTGVFVLQNVDPELRQAAMTSIVFNSSQTRALLSVGKGGLRDDSLPQLVLLHANGVPDEHLVKYLADFRREEFLGNPIELGISHEHETTVIWCSPRACQQIRQLVEPAFRTQLAKEAGAVGALDRIAFDLNSLEPQIKPTLDPEEASQISREVSRLRTGLTRVVAPPSMGYELEGTWRTLPSLVQTSLRQRALTVQTNIEHRSGKLAETAAALETRISQAQQVWILQQQREESNRNLQLSNANLEAAEESATWTAWGVWAAFGIGLAQIFSTRVQQKAESIYNWGQRSVTVLREKVDLVLRPKSIGPGSSERPTPTLDTAAPAAPQPLGGPPRAGDKG